MYSWASGSFLSRSLETACRIVFDKPRYLYSEVHDCAALSIVDVWRPLVVVTVGMARRWVRSTVCWNGLHVERLSCDWPSTQTTFIYRYVIPRRCSQRVQSPPLPSETTLCITICGAVCGSGESLPLRKSSPFTSKYLPPIHGSANL